MVEPREQKIICFDFDGTLCEDRYPDIGEPNLSMIRLMYKLHAQGYYLIINSTRRSLDYDRVKRFLKDYAVSYDQLCLSSRPVADLYIDDKGLYADPRILEALIEQRFLSQYSYLEAMAKEQLTSDFANNIYDVPEAGGGDKQDDRFAIGLAMTGGMDSTTMWRMLEESGTPYHMFYFNMGQPYADAELATIHDITGKDPITIILPLSFAQHKHILSGRNAIIILRMAEIMQDMGCWGEVWFGNLQGESPIVGGDKSRRFFNDLNTILAFNQVNTRIVNPLIGMDKTDEVYYWKARGELDTLKKTKTCFSAEMGQCGRCQACFLKWVAFTSAGVDCSDIFQGMDFQEHIEKYRRVMGIAYGLQDFSHYSPSRIRHTMEAIQRYDMH